MTLRLISSFVLYDGSGDHAANNVVRMTFDTAGAAGGPYSEDVEIAADGDGTTYWMANDGAADDFVKVFGDAVTTAMSAHWGAAESLFLIIGVTATSSTMAEGRPYWGWLNAYDSQFNFGHANTNIDPRILGFAEDATDEDMDYADFVHRYGSYLAQTPNECEQTKHTNTVVSYSRGGYSTSRKWGADYYKILVDVWPVLPALMRLEAATDSTKAALALLTQNDPNAPLETFQLDLADGSNRSFRVYPDASDEDTYLGPYRHDEGAVWMHPFDECGKISKAAEQWRAVITGRTAL